MSRSSQEHVLIDVTRLVHRRFRGLLPTGVDRVCVAYLERYGERASALLRIGGRWVTLDRHGSQSIFAALVDRAPCSRLALVARLARAVAAPLRRTPRHGVLLNVGHSGLEHPRYAFEVRRRKLRALYFVHDLIPITHPQFARPGQDAKHRRRMLTALESGHALVVNSRCTRDELASHARNIGRHLPRTAVAPLAPASLPAPMAVPPIEAPYFVIVGTIEPRKNHALLLQLWRQLGQELGARAPRLVVIGQPGWGSARTVRLLENCPQLRRLVTWRAHCTDGELAHWIGHARALLFPSLVEGYGLPLVEALALGTPVIASRLPVFREIAGDIPEFLDPLDASAWRDGVLDYLSPESARARLQRSRLGGFAAPGWEAHFAIVDHLIESCLRSPSDALAQGDWAYAPFG